MNNKNIVITGGNAGIGLATGIALAKMGANIFFVSRNENKAKQALSEIQQASGNKNIQYLIADLSSQKSIWQLNKNLRERLDKIDVLINNAGAVFPEFTKSEDGLEMTIATNHFAYFLLSNLTLDLIKKSKDARIINVASRGHVNGLIDFESFTQNKKYFILKAYAQSKLANVLFTKELAHRLGDTDITVNALHPGLVKTHIGNKKSTWLSSFVWSAYAKLGGISIEKGAATSIYLASSDKVKDLSGLYFARCKTTPPSKLAQNVALQKELWKVSEQLCPIQ